MHQYFADKPVQVGQRYVFTDEQAHHARDVVKLKGDKIRLVYDGKAFFGVCDTIEGKIGALVTEEDEGFNELSIDLTLAPALIRREKFELVLQKAAELGVNHIVPYESSRCVVHSRRDKSDRQRVRWQAILTQAASQCKRNRIPDIKSVLDFTDLQNIDAELKIFAYENSYGCSPYLSQVIKHEASVLIVIGPEGGFADEEADFLRKAGFTAVTFGSRILKAETASLYACSVINELDGKKP